MDTATSGSCDRNATNGTSVAEHYALADTYTVVVGSLIFLAMAPLMRLNLSVFPLGSLFAVLLGAVLMVAFRVVGQDEAYDVVTRGGSLTAALLLVGVLVIAQYVDRERAVVGVVRRLLLPSLRFEDYLARVCLVVFAFAALFSSDACCALVTPVVLQVWDAQERPRGELDTLLLAVMTSANIGAMVTVFSSLQMALIAARTRSDRLAGSRLDMRACLVYLLPAAALMWTVNTCLLAAHHRARTRRIERSKLVSEPSHSEQEMAGLTAGHGNGSANGYLPNGGRPEPAARDGAYFGPAAGLHSDERIAMPCQLETIPEDDILEIGGPQNDTPPPPPPPPPPRGRYDDDDDDERGPSALDGSDSSSSSSSSSNGADGDGERDRMRNTDENLHQLNISYRPGALQSQSLAADSCTSLIRSLERQSLVISHRLGVYHSLRAFSVTHFLPTSATCDDGGGDALLPSDSVLFLVTLSVLMVVVVILLLVSCYDVTFDLGLVPLAAAVFAVTTDAVLNRRPALALVKRADWSVILLLFALFVWIQGFHNTHLVRFIWHRVGLQGTSYGAMSVKTLSVLCTFIVLGNNLFGSVPIVLIVCDLLEPCAYQRGIVLYLAVLCTAGNNLTLYSSTANLIAVQRGIQILKYRLPFLTHLQYGFLSSLILLPFGILLIYGLLLLGVK